MARDESMIDPPLAGEQAGMPRAQWPPVRRLGRAVMELLRARGRLDHVPTLAQVRAMASFGGTQPCSYLLDPTVNWLPPIAGMPVGVEDELGRQALAFSCRLPCGHDAELVVLPSGGGFDLLGCGS